MMHFYSFKNPILFFVLFFFFSFPFIGHTTIVIPPPDIGEMVYMTDYVVYGKVTSYKDQDGYINNFEISDVIKGDLMLGETILLKEYCRTIGDNEMVVAGDVDFIIGKEYLLFLFKDQEGHFKLNLMYFSAFENAIIDRNDLLAHNSESIGVTTADDIDPNLTGAYLKNNFIAHLKQIANGETSWNVEDAGFIEGVFISDLQKQGRSSSRSTGLPPDHCTPLSGNADDFGTTCLPSSPAKFKTNIWEVCVSSSADDVAGYTTELNDLERAIRLLNDMPGVNMTYGGVSACPVDVSCTSVGSESRDCQINDPCVNKIWVFFDDPCNQIPDQTACGGIVGQGGHFFNNTCHEDECGNMWRNASSPSLVLNTGIGCLSRAQVRAIMAHELLHSIGIGHIEGTCTALMNPGLCNSPAPSNSNDFGKTALDDMCTDWLYGEKCAPTTVANNTGAVCAGDGTDTYETWKTSIANANPSANIVYSSVMPTVCPNMLTHDNIEPDGSHSGTGCSSETETVMAYDFYDCDSDGNPDGGDKYTLISNYTLTVFPLIQAPTITTNSCVLTVTGQCPDDVITLSSQTIGAGVITNNGTNAVTYTAQPGDATGSVTINITSGLTGNTCTYTATTATPACPSNCPTLATPTALSITSESTCGTNCTPAGGAWALLASPCLAGSSLQSFTTAIATTGGIAMTTAPTYNQTVAETYHVRCVCDTDATMVSDVQTISSTPGTCTDPVAPTLTIANNVCPTTIGTIIATGGTGTLHYFTGTNAMSNATNNVGGTTTTPAYAAFPTAVNICVVETDANGCRSAPSCDVTVPVNCIIPCPTFTTPTALSIISESSCGTGCAPAGGAWALAASPCPAGSTLQSFTTALATTGGIAMISAPTYDQITTETYYVRCVCGSNATMVSPVQTISSTPGSCTDPMTPTLNIINNVCPSTTGSISAIGTGGTLQYFTGTNAMSNAMINSGGTTIAPAYAIAMNVCVVETDANGCRSAPACETTLPNECVCSLVNANLDNIQCGNNNTSLDPTDDYITFTLNPTGENLGASYTVSGGGVMPNTAQNYGSAITFTLPVGSAGGGDVPIIITDVSGGTCTINEIVIDQGVCSDFVFTGNNTGGDTFMATDPCSCNGDQVLNSNGSVAVAGTFSETVTVNGLPNLNVRIKTISASTDSDPSLMAFALTETPASSGTYVVTFNHIDRIGYNISEFEFSTAADPATFMLVLDDAGFPVTVTNRCAYPTIVCSPVLASSMQITDAPISLSATELSTDITFLGGVSTFTINGTAASVFDPANSPAIVGNNTIVATYDFTSGTGQGGLPAALGAPAIPLDADGDPSNGVCPISLPAKTVNVIGEQAIPTMSQWGLIIFGLLILNMLVVLLYRKEQLLAE